MPVRTLAALMVVVAAAGVLVSSAPAQAPAKATASAAVITGDLGRVARVRASGDDAASSSVPARTPKGIVLGDGFVSVSTSVSQLSAEASAEADDLELFGGVVTAALVARKATSTGSGVKYSGSVRGLVVGDREIDEVKGTKSYAFDGGTVTANQDGAGLIVELTDDVGGVPAGTRIVVADVSATATRGASPTAEPTAEPTRTAEPSATAAPTATATPKPRKPTGYRTRLMSRRFVFPVGGPTTIGGPFGSYRAQGDHQGNDLFADFGTPVVAAADGVLANVGTLPISGNRLWVYADSGDQFFYAHLSAFSPNAVNDRHVEAGTILGYVGNTGDAEPTPPHLHFEIHPDGGDAVDPEDFLAAWRKRAGATTTSDTAERPGALVEVRDFIGEG